jgi:hypothetical protein
LLDDVITRGAQFEPDAALFTVQDSSRDSNIPENAHEMVLKVGFLSRVDQ